MKPCPFVINMRGKLVRRLDWQFAVLTSMPIPDYLVKMNAEMVRKKREKHKNDQH